MHENVGSSERPIGKKKEKMKRKTEDEMKKLIESLVEDSKELKECFKNHKREKKEESEKYGQLQVLQAQNEATKLEILREREVIRREREENKIIMIDLDSIKNPIEREFFRRKKIQILEKNSDNSQIHGGAFSGGYGSHLDGFPKV